MENRQRTIRKLLWRITAVLAVLAVVSICFVSGTFARYVSNRNGSSVTKVAKWDIDFTDGTNAVVENNFTVTVGKLSPSKDEFPTPAENGEVKNRVKYSGTVLALKITNSGDVDAYLTITGADNTDVYGTNLIYYGTYSETAGGSNAYKNPDGAEEGELVWGTIGFADNGTPSAAQAEAVITMQFALTNTNKQPDESASEWQSYASFLKAYSQPSTIPGTDDGSLRWLAAKDGETVETRYVWARAVWTSQDKDSTEDAANALDTWFGEHIAAVGAAFTFSVVQASELPESNP